jgi:hypothetical protein
MAGSDPKPPPGRSAEEKPSAKDERNARLAQALRTNLRRRKAAPASPPKADSDIPKAD